MKGDVASMRLLLSYGADPRVLDQIHHWSVLHHAIDRKQERIVEELLNEVSIAAVTRPLIFHSDRNGEDCFALASDRRLVSICWFLCYVRILQLYPRAFGEPVRTGLEPYITAQLQKAIDRAPNKHIAKPFKFFTTGLKVTVYQVVWRRDAAQNAAAAAAAAVPHDGHAKRAARRGSGGHRSGPLVSSSSLDQAVSVPAGAVSAVVAGADGAAVAGAAASERPSVSRKNKASAAGAAPGAAAASSPASLFAGMSGSPPAHISAALAPPVITVPCAAPSSFRAHSSTRQQAGEDVALVTVSHRRARLTGDGRGLLLLPQSGSLLGGKAKDSEYLPFGPDTRITRAGSTHASGPTLQVVVSTDVELHFELTEETGKSLTAAYNGLKSVVSTILPYHRGKLAWDAYATAAVRLLNGVATERRGIWLQKEHIAATRAEVENLIRTEKHSAAGSDYANAKKIKAQRVELQAALEAAELQLRACVAADKAQERRGQAEAVAARVREQQQQHNAAVGKHGAAAASAAQQQHQHRADAATAREERQKAVLKLLQDGAELQDLLHREVRRAEAALTEYEAVEREAGRKTEWDRAQSAHTAKQPFLFAREVLHRCLKDTEAVMAYVGRGDSPPDSPRINPTATPVEGLVFQQELLPEDQRQQQLLHSGEEEEEYDGVVIAPPHHLQEMQMQQHQQKQQQNVEEDEFAGFAAADDVWLSQSQQQQQQQQVAAEFAKPSQEPSLYPSIPRAVVDTPSHKQQLQQQQHHHQQQQSVSAEPSPRFSNVVMLQDRGSVSASASPSQLSRQSSAVLAVSAASVAAAPVAAGAVAGAPAVPARASRLAPRQSSNASASSLVSHPSMPGDGPNWGLHVSPPGSGSVLVDAPPTYDEAMSMSPEEIVRARVAAAAVPYGVHHEEEDDGAHLAHAPVRATAIKLDAVPIVETDDGLDDAVALVPARALAAAGPSPPGALTAPPDSPRAPVVVSPATAAILNAIAAVSAPPTAAAASASALNSFAAAARADAAAAATPGEEEEEGDAFMALAVGPAAAAADAEEVEEGASQSHTVSLSLGAPAPVSVAASSTATTTTAMPPLPPRRPTLTVATSGVAAAGASAYPAPLSLRSPGAAFVPLVPASPAGSFNASEADGQIEGVAASFTEADSSSSAARSFVFPPAPAAPVLAFASAPPVTGSLVGSEAAGVPAISTAGDNEGVMIGVDDDDAAIVASKEAGTSSIAAARRRLATRVSGTWDGGALVAPASRPEGTPRTSPAETPHDKAAVVAFSLDDADVPAHAHAHAHADADADVGASADDIDIGVIIGHSSAPAAVAPAAGAVEPSVASLGLTDAAAFADLMPAPPSESHDAIFGDAFGQAAYAPAPPATKVQPAATVAAAAPAAASKAQPMGFDLAAVADVLASAPVPTHTTITPHRPQPPVQAPAQSQAHAAPALPSRASKPKAKEAPKRAVVLM
jgi:hypothetical protein